MLSTNKRCFNQYSSSQLQQPVILELMHRFMSSVTFWKGLGYNLCSVLNLSIMKQLATEAVNIFYAVNNADSSCDQMSLTKIYALKILVYGHLCINVCGRFSQFPHISSNLRCSLPISAMERDRGN